SASAQGRRAASTRTMMRSASPGPSTRLDPPSQPKQSPSDPCSHSVTISTTLISPPAPSGHPRQPPTHSCFSHHQMLVGRLVTLLLLVGYSTAASGHPPHAEERCGSGHERRSGSPLCH